MVRTPEEILAPTTTPPLETRTVPPIWAALVCANTAVALRNRKSASIHTLPQPKRNLIYISSRSEIRALTSAG